MNPHFNLQNLMNFPLNIYWKNTKRYYLGCNDQLAKTVGFQNKEALIHTQLYDFCTVQCANLIEAIDTQVMEEAKTYCTIEPAYLRNNVKKLYLSIKTPLYTNRNKVTGLFGVSLHLGSLSYEKTIQFISMLGVPLLKNDMMTKAVLHYYDEKNQYSPRKN